QISTLFPTRRSSDLHMRLIAMNFAIRAEWFLISPRTLASAQFNIFQKLVALCAKPFFAFMFFLTIQPYHKFYDFQFFTLFHNFPDRKSTRLNSSHVS